MTEFNSTLVEGLLIISGSLGIGNFRTDTTRESVGVLSGSVEYN